MDKLFIIGLILMITSAVVFIAGLYIYLIMQLLNGTNEAIIPLLLIPLVAGLLIMLIATNN